MAPEPDEIFIKPDLTLLELSVESVNEQPESLLGEAELISDPPGRHPFNVAFL